MNAGPAKFSLGHVVATPAALRFCGLNLIDPSALLLRHAAGDWGDLTDDDKAANERALVDGSRLLSSYTFAAGTVWVITDAVDDDGVRLSTILMLPSDY